MPAPDPTTDRLAAPEPHPREQEFMRRAIALSRQALEEGTGRPFGSVIVRGDEVVAEGINRVVIDHDCTAHAEIGAIRAAGQVLGTHDLSGCVIYASSEPCGMCAAAISMARIEGIVFGAPELAERRWAGFRHPLTREQAALRTLDRELPARQILAEEALAVLDDESAP